MPDGRAPPPTILRLPGLPPNARQVGPVHIAAVPIQGQRLTTVGPNVPSLKEILEVLPPDVQSTLEQNLASLPPGNRASFIRAIQEDKRIRDMVIISQNANSQIQNALLARGFQPTVNTRPQLTAVSAPTFQTVTQSRPEGTPAVITAFPIRHVPPIPGTQNPPSHQSDPKFSTADSLTNRTIDNITEGMSDNAETENMRKGTAGQEASEAEGPPPKKPRYTDTFKPASSKKAPKFKCRECNKTFNHKFIIEDHIRKTHQTMDIDSCIIGTAASSTKGSSVCSEPDAAISVSGTSDSGNVGEEGPQKPPTAPTGRPGNPYKRIGLDRKRLIGVLNDATPYDPHVQPQPPLQQQQQQQQSNSYQENSDNDVQEECTNVIDLTKPETAQKHPMKSTLEETIDEPRDPAAKRIRSFVKHMKANEVSLDKLALDMKINLDGNSPKIATVPSLTTTSNDLTLGTPGTSVSGSSSDKNAHNGLSGGTAGGQLETSTSHTTVGSAMVTKPENLPRVDSDRSAFSNAKFGQEDAVSTANVQKAQVRSAVIDTDCNQIPPLRNQRKKMIGLERHWLLSSGPRGPMDVQLPGPTDVPVSLSQSQSQSQHKIYNDEQQQLRGPQKESEEPGREIEQQTKQQSSPHVEKYKYVQQTPSQRPPTGSVGRPGNPHKLIGSDRKRLIGVINDAIPFDPDVPPQQPLQQQQQQQQQQQSNSHQENSDNNVQQNPSSSSSQRQPATGTGRPGNAYRLIGSDKKRLIGVINDAIPFDPDVPPQQPLQQQQQQSNSHQENSDNNVQQACSSSSSQRQPATGTGRPGNAYRLIGSDKKRLIGVINDAIPYDPDDQLQQPLQQQQQQSNSYQDNTDNNVQQMPNSSSPQRRTTTSSGLPGNASRLVGSDRKNLVGVLNDAPVDPLQQQLQQQQQQQQSNSHQENSNNNVQQTPISSSSQRRPPNSSSSHEAVTALTGRLGNAPRTVGLDHKLSDTSVEPPARSINVPSQSTSVKEPHHRNGEPEIARATKPRERSGVTKKPIGMETHYFLATLGPSPRGPVIGPRGRDIVMRCEIDMGQYQQRLNELITITQPNKHGWQVTEFQQKFAEYLQAPENEYKEITKILKNKKILGKKFSLIDDFKQMVKDDLEAINIKIKPPSISQEQIEKQDAAFRRATLQGVPDQNSNGLETISEKTKVSLTSEKLEKQILGENTKAVSEKNSATLMEEPIRKQTLEGVQMDDAFYHPLKQLQKMRDKQIENKDVKGNKTNLRVTKLRAGDEETMIEKQTLKVTREQDAAYYTEKQLAEMRKINPQVTKLPVGDEETMIEKQTLEVTREQDAVYYSEKQLAEIRERNLQATKLRVDDETTMIKKQTLEVTREQDAGYYTEKQLAEIRKINPQVTKLPVGDEETMIEKQTLKVTRETRCSVLL